MAIAAQQSVSSLSNYSLLQESNGPYPTPSWNFCNSFWGESDEGANVLFTRMRTAIKTSEELQNFWSQRAAIEEEFGKRLAVLARMPVGADETGELQNSLQALTIETQRKAESHIQLASNIRRELIEPVARFHDKQIDRKRVAQTPVEKKVKAKLGQASYVAKAREKYEGDIARIKTYKQQVTQAQGLDFERLQTKLRRAQETVKANERDYTNFVRELSDLSAEWEVEWKDFCDNCQDLEEERMEFMKDNVWNYANMISTICVSDDESCEKIRTALDQLEPDRDLIAFVEAQATGNRVADPPLFVPIDPQNQTPTAAAPSFRTVHYDRISRKPEPVYQNASVAGAQVAPTAQPVQEPIAAAVAAIQSDPRPNGAETKPGYERENPTAGAPVPSPPYGIPPPPPIPVEPERQVRRGQSLRRQSQPLPHPPGASGSARTQDPPAPAHIPVPVTEAGNRILFLVKALYDYKATIEEEFDFQAGDIIAVTETPDDGWWSGELLDEARNIPGRHIFPSNYVCLF